MTGSLTPVRDALYRLAVAEEGASAQAGWAIGAITQMGLAVIVGTAVGFVGGKLLDAAQRRKWTFGAPLQFAVLALALAAYLGSVAIGGNGFIAAFIAGIVFGAVSRDRLAESAEYTEATGTLLSLFVWTIFGAVIAAPVVKQAFDWARGGLCRAESDGDPHAAGCPVFVQTALQAGYRGCDGLVWPTRAGLGHLWPDGL